MSAQPSPAGPAPIIATRLLVITTFDISGFQPNANAVSVMYFSAEPMVYSPKSITQRTCPSHRRSCGQTQPQTSGKSIGLVTQFYSFKDVALGNQLQPVWYVVMNRTLPLHTDYHIQDNDVPDAWLHLP